ncbi:ATP-binding protein [Streptomyces sp. NPDC053367]|uniref:ATP-binding protein n=1 Tax=Streptomyces sp. NPDC053367 TaxID=3365700 RepID=UPI0037D518F3
MGPPAASRGGTLPGVDAHPPGGAVSPKERSGLRGFADRWPLRRKLDVLLGVPLAVIALLLAYLVTDLLQESRRAREAAQLVRDSTQVARLVDRLEAEHQQAILLSVRHEAAEGVSPPSVAAYRDAQKVVDRQIAEVRRAFGDRLPLTEAQALREVEGLDGLRATVEQGYLPADNIDPAYAGAARGLIDGLGLGRDPALAAGVTGSLLDSLLRAGAAHGSFETGVFAASTRDSNALTQLLAAVGSFELYTHQADRFTRLATEEQAEELRGMEHNSAQAAITLTYAELRIDPSGVQAASPPEVRTAFRRALADYPDYRAQAGVRLGVTTSLIGQVADRADRAATDAQWRAGLLLGLAVFGCLAWLALSVVVRRSVVRPVRSLTAAAREVAEVAGRELARVADDDAEDESPPKLRAMPVTARDEIGELADAFNHVQTTAAALLERQVLSRRNVAEMFGNVGRRVSNLTTRQLALIDAVERGETDPALLERLYRIDHIAVRLRRNADSLMLLAGLRETVLDSGPVRLSDVVRAALGQIEGYQRVALHAGTEALASPDVSGDLTLMVAELLDNAVRFSPSGSPVEVTVAAGADGAIVTVADHGLGLSAERLAEENARLVRRERLDLVPTKVLGLFVVGTLARRWSIGVTLSRTRGGGVTAEVAVPGALLVPEGPGAGAGAPAETGSSARVGGSADAHVSRDTASETVASGTSAEAGLPSGPSPATAGGGSRTGADANAGAGADGDAGAGAGEAASVAAPRPPAQAPGAGDGPVQDNPPLPRRVPRRAEPAGGEGGAALIPRARTEAGPAPGTALRRRVRGASLRTTTAPEAGHRAPGRSDGGRDGAGPVDADVVRSELEEFEAAVERAHRDSAGQSGSARPEADPPEGAEQ